MADKDFLTWEQFAKLKNKLGPKSAHPLRNKIFRQILLDQFSDFELVNAVIKRDVKLLIAEGRMIETLEAEGKFVVVPLDTDP